MDYVPTSRATVRPVRGTTHETTTKTWLQKAVDERYGREPSRMCKMANGSEDLVLANIADDTHARAHL